MNYQNYFDYLLKQAFSAKQYKRMPAVSRVFGFIGVFPFIALAAVLSIFYSVLVFIFNLCSTSVVYLENWLNKTKSDVRTPTEPVLYFLALPYIIFNHIVLSVLSVMFFVLWFFMQCAFYIATLGTIKWQPYITKVDLNDESVAAPITSLKDAKATAGIIGSLFIVYVTMQAISIFGELANYTPIYTDSLDFASLSVLSLVGYVYFLATAITVPIVFRKKLVSAEEVSDTAAPKGGAKTLLATIIPVAIVEIVIMVVFVAIPFGHYNSGVDHLKEEEYGLAYDSFIAAEDWGITDSYKQYDKALNKAYDAAEDLARDGDYAGAYAILRHFEEVSKIDLDPIYDVYKEYANRRPIKYSFNSNGGYKIDPISSPAEINLPIPKRDGYYFAGWYTDTRFTNRANSPFKSDEDITLYAKWTKE